MLTGGNVRTTLENAVGRLSLEPTLKLVGWERIEDASDLEIGSNSPHRRKLRRRQNPDGDLMRSNIDPGGKHARHDPGVEPAARSVMVDTWCRSRRLNTGQILVRISTTARASCC